MSHIDPATPGAADVVIVGAGPVGQILSLLLAARGRQVALVERWGEPYPLPRAVAASHDVRRVLDLLGLGPELKDLFEPWGQNGHRILFEDAHGEPLLQTKFALESVSGHAEMSAFSQPELERLLDRRVRSDPLIDVRRNYSLTSLTESEDGVTAIIEPHDGLAPIAGGVTSSVTAAYIVGCDGANSTVRELISAGVTDLGFDRDWFVVDVHLDPERISVPYATQHLDPARPTTIAPAGPGRKRWEFMLLDTDDPELIGTDEFAWTLLRPWRVDVTNAELERHARYTFRARWAEQWHRRRVVLAGDAAHQMPPFLGQGFNSGVRDAVNLAWRLDLLIAGIGGPALLEHYEMERRAHVRQIIEETVHTGHLICMTDPDEAASRDARMRRGAAVVRPAKSSWPVHGGTLRPHSRDPASGRPVLQARVVDGRHSVMLDELTSPFRFLLIGYEADPLRALDGPTRAEWDELGGTSIYFGPGGIGDADGVYGRWFAGLGANVILVRPDQLIYGSATTDHKVDELVREAATLIRTGRAAQLVDGSAQ
jgi:flavoprotein hydroxylase